MSAKSAIARNDCSISIGRLQLLFRLDLRLTSSDPKIIIAVFGMAHVHYSSLGAGRSRRIERSRPEDLRSVGSFSDSSEDRENNVLPFVAYSVLSDFEN
jgi:hypothetical protein